MRHDRATDVSHLLDSKSIKQIPIHVVDGPIASIVQQIVDGSMVSIVGQIVDGFGTKLTAFVCASFLLEG